MLPYEFYARSCLDVAADLVGKVLVHRLPDGRELRARISETEAYAGVNDTACHAHKGKTARSRLLWEKAGTVYVYLCYGMHWMLNVITGEEGDPQGVLIRACVDHPGPGKLSKFLSITKELNASSILDGQRLWIEDDGLRPHITRDTRVGIGYASAEDQARLWRFKMEEIKKTP